jgi:hypothetical protein
MRPYSDINLGDVYKSFAGSEWLVLELNDEEKMVQVQMMTDHRIPELQQPIWKKHTDSLFSCRLQSGANLSMAVKASMPNYPEPLTPEEIAVVLDDQLSTLRSDHVPPLDKCGDMDDCPFEHFDVDGIQEEIKVRQALIKKLRPYGAKS